MGVIVFASLKGGVGKTSLSINVAHSFSRRGCRTLLIDLDPAGHTSRFFKSQLVLRRTQSNGAQSNANGSMVIESPLAKLFFEAARSENAEVEIPDDSLLIKARPDLDVLASGEELRHFLWGRGNQLFARYFPKFIKNLKLEYDHVVIDTPPDFNTLTRNSLAAADVVIVPASGVLIEALACGCVPVTGYLAANQSDFHNAVIAEDGLFSVGVIDADYPAKLASTLRLLMDSQPVTNSKIRSRLGASGNSILQAFKNLSNEGI